MTDIESSVIIVPAVKQCRLIERMPPVLRLGRKRLAALQKILDSNEIVLVDGAMGTMLFEAGLEPGGAPETWNVSHPESVKAIHKAYLDVGSRIILTNTFGGSPFMLGRHNLQDRVAELNETGAKIAREAVEESGHEALVAGDIGPSGELLVPLGTLEADEALEGFSQQAAALAAGGVDLIWIETMSALEEIQAAIRGAQQAAPHLPIAATMTFDTHGHTMMGISPEKATETLIEAGATIIGANCGNGPQEIIEVIEKMHAVAPDITLIAKSNAGIPQLDGTRVVYSAGPGEMASYAQVVRSKGARIIGSCCGSTPAHVKAIAEALKGVAAAQ